MATTDFSTGTVIEASWLDDVDEVVYTTLPTYLAKSTAVLVSALPSAVTEGGGTRRFVSDANATTFASIVAGGGANFVPVYSDGTNWRIG